VWKKLLQFQILSRREKLKITLISNNTFSIYGGYEKIVYLVLKKLKEAYNCETSIVSLPHYRSSLNNSIIKDFMKFRIYRYSDYKDKFHYLSYLILKNVLNNKLLINFNSIKRYIDVISSSEVVLITDSLLVIPVNKALKEVHSNAKIIYWDHGSLMGYLKGKIQNIVYRNEIFESLKLADGYLAISSEIADTIKSIKHDANVYIVYNPVPVYNGPLIKRSTYPIFLYVGRLSDKDKNLSFLLKSMAKIKHEKWKLIIIGSGEDEKKLKNLGNNLKIADRIVWLGFRKEPFAGIKEATALVLSSRWEGFPMVLVEANQRGIPVISSDCKAGPKDIVIPGGNGYLYKEGDMTDFLKIVNDVIEGRSQFDTPEDIAKTVERFREDVVIANIYNALNKISKGVYNGAI